MSEAKLIPSIENRLGALLEVSRRQGSVTSEEALVKPAIMVSREFGCEAYPMAELLRQQMEKRTGESWALMDRALLDEVSKNHNLSDEVLKNLGDKNRFVDDFLSTFSSRWKSEKDYFRLLTRHIIALAEKGNVIIIGRGAPIVTRNMKNCLHFRMYASLPFKQKSIGKRLSVDAGEAEAIISRRQKERDKFIRDFLDRDPYDLSVYHLVFNNDKNNAAKIADTIADYALKP